MDVPDTIGWVSAPVDQRPLAPPAPLPAPAPAPRRRWRWAVVVAGGITLAALGVLTGFVLGDDADAVQKLEDAALDSEDEIEDLEAQLADVDDAQAALEDDLQLCADASSSTQSLLTAVDNMSNAYDDFMMTPVGSPEEAEAGVALDNSFHDVIGTTRAVRLDTEACLESTKP
jgi:hypothetical protein